MTTRSEREKQASDETPIYENWHHLQRRFSHIFDCPNSRRSDDLLKTLLQTRIEGASVLEIGCGSGAFAECISQMGAAYVLATDISEVWIREAKVREIPGTLEFVVADASRPLNGQFDLIVGHSVLHHIDYEEVIARLMNDNLKSEGMMLFYEPLASNWIMRIFRHFSKHAHTPDEQAFDRQALAGIQIRYPAFNFIPFNFVSIPFGAVSSFLFRSSGNVLMRIADRIDWYLANHILFLRPYFRTAILVFFSSHEKKRIPWASEASKSAVC